MLRLKTFGGLTLRSDDGRVVEQVQRRRMALLVLLAAAGEPGMSRDKLLLYLWPENDLEHGRNLLRQALHALRRDLKAPELFLGGADLRLNPDVITSDVCEFQDLLKAGDARRAVGLYSGPFLDGVHLTDAPEFDQWADERRTHFARLAAGALESLATSAGAEGDHQASAGWWARLAALDPLNGRVAVALMEAMAAAGNPAGALQHARVHETLVRAELGAEPSPEVVEAAERIRSSPPRCSRPIPAVTEVPVPAPAGAEPVMPAGRAAAHASRDHWRAWLPLGLVVLVGVAGVGLASRGGRDGPPPGPRAAEVVVVAPFRVTGTDSGLRYLGEGLMDLLAARFTGEAGPRSASPLAVMREWQRDSGATGDSLPLLVARKLGARYLVQGSVVGTSHRMTLSGTLTEGSTGSMLAQATATGPEDSLPILVDRIAAQLLVGTSPEPGADRVRDDALTRVPLPALRAYLDAQRAYRRGHYAEAKTGFERALEIDSTFAQAALRAAMTGYWIRGSAWTDALDLAWRHRARLSPRQRIILDAIAGPNYPATAWWSEDLAAAERAVTAAPDRAVTWFLLGDVLFHLGPGLGRANAWGEAGSRFRQALALDSSFAPPLEHLLELAAATGATDELRRIASGPLQGDSTREHADFLRWRAAVALEDTAALRRIRRRFERMPVASLLRIVGTGQLEALAPADVDSAAAVLRRRVAPQPERWLIGRTLHYHALNRGRITEAAVEVPLPAEGEPVPRWAARMTVLDALFGDGDSVAARAAAARLDPDGGARSPRSLDRAAASADLCVLELWRLMRGETAGALAAIERLREPIGVDSIGAARSDSLCALILDAVYTHRRGDRSAAGALRALDSVMRLGPAATNDVESFANLVVGRLHAERGDLGPALAAVRRRPYQWAYGPIYLSTFLFEEQRLARLAGDTAAARSAARRYLALRTDPDPPLAEQVARVKGGSGEPR